MNQWGRAALPVEEVPLHLSDDLPLPGHLMGLSQTPLSKPLAFALDENSSPDQDERSYGQQGQRKHAQIVAKD